MNDFKKNVRQWLKAIGKDREWLAEQCFTAKVTIDNWFSAKGTIPPAKQALIEQLMNIGINTIKPSYIEILEKIETCALAFTKDEWDVIKLAAQLNNSSPEEYIKGVVCVDALINVRNRSGATTISDHTAIECEIASGQLDITQIRDRLERISTTYSGIKSIIGNAKQLHAMPTVENHKRPPAKYKSVKSPSLQPWSEIEEEEKQPESYKLICEGNIAAGDLMDGDGIPHPVQVDKKYPKGSYALRVCGASMEPLIPHDSIIVVTPWTEPEPPKLGTIVVYWDGRGVTLKKLSEHKTPSGKEHILTSINPLYPDITPFDGGSISAIHVATLP